MTVDTLDYVKTLEAVGVERKVAEARAAAFSKALTDDYVTKHYLDNKAADLRAYVDGKIGELKTEIASVKADVLLMKWMLGFVLALCVAILLKLLS